MKIADLVSFETTLTDMPDERCKACGALLFPLINCELGKILYCITIGCTAPIVFIQKKADAGKERDA